VKDVLAKGKKRGWKAVHLNGMSLSDGAKVTHNLENHILALTLR
jgi:hypothetical protein